VIGKETCCIQLCTFLPFTVERIGSIFHKSSHFIIKYVYSTKRNYILTALCFITVNPMYVVGMWMQECRHKKVH
jgi:hypothetical protein